MKKLFLLSLMAVVLGFSASAQRLVNPNEARINKAGIIKATPQMVSSANRYYGTSLTAPSQFSDLGKGLKRLSPKAAADYEVFYVRPEATFELAFDWETSRGYPDRILGPAFAPVKWTNRSDDGITATWLYFDMNSEEMQESEETDLVMTPAATTIGYWNYMPYLAVTEDDFYQDTLNMKYGGEATLTFDDLTQATYQVAAFDVWTDLCCLDDYWTVYNYVDLEDEDSGDAAWTTELQEIYPDDAANISNARVKGLVQFLGTPAAPYIINNVRWLAYWISPVRFSVKLRVLGQDENGQYTRVLAEASQPCEPHTQFTGAWLQYPLQTELEGGGVQEGVVIDGPAVLELTGFHEDGEDKITRFMSTTNVMYSELMEKRLEFNSGVHVDFDYNNNGTVERLSTFERATAGYYTTDAKDTVAYLHSYNVYFDLEYPFLYSDESKFEMPTTGGQEEFVMSANHISEEWEITDENGSFDLPEWVSLDFADTYVDDSDIYNDTTNISLTAEALPEGLAGRQAKIYISYPSFDNPAAQKVLIINQGEVAEAPSEFYMVGSFNEWNTTEEGGRLAFTAGEEEGVYTAQGELAAGAEFKIIVPDGEGWKWYGGVDENGVGYFLINNELLETPLQMVDGSNFRMENGGKFTFVVNANDMTLTLIPEQTAVIGDVNGDGYVTSADVTAIYDVLLGTDMTFEVTADVNGDGYVTSADVTAVYDILLGVTGE